MAPGFLRTAAYATRRRIWIAVVLQDEPKFRRGCPIRVLLSLEHVSLVFIWKWWQGLASFIFSFHPKQSTDPWMEQILSKQVINEWTRVTTLPRAHACKSVCVQTNLEVSLNMEFGIMLPVSQSNFYNLRPCPSPWPI